MRTVPLKLIAFCAAMILVSCSKHDEKTGGDGVDPAKPPTDPEVAKTIGFMLDDWQSRTFSIPGNAKDTTISASPSYVITVDPYKIITKVPPGIFGDNANVVTSQFVTETALMNKINLQDPTYIRYPSGDNSNTFFWNAAEGTLPPDVPTTLYDRQGNIYSPKYSFGKSNASNTLSLDNYYSMLQQTGSKGIITVNYAYARYSTAATPVAAAAHLAADWVRYDNGRTKYWEIGNENYGNWQPSYRINTADNKDGQPEIITGDIYGDHFKVIADSMKKAATEIGKSIYIGGVLVEGIYSASTPTEIDWNNKTINKIHSSADFYSLHNFYTPFGVNSDAAYILYTTTTSSKLMADYVNAGFKAAGVEAKPLAMTQYNIFAVNSSQGPSFINGMHSISTLGEILNNKLGMAMRFGLTDAWNSGNSYGMYSFDDPGVEKWTARPAFYYMQYFRRFLGDRVIASSIDNSSAEVLSYASSFTSGQIGLTLMNKSEVEKVVKIDLKYWKPGSKVYWYTLTGGTDGQFSRKVIINGRGPAGVAGGPDDFQNIPAYSSSTDGGIVINLPKRGTVMLAFDAIKPTP
jgi:hypothetical protein